MARYRLSVFAVAAGRPGARVMSQRNGRVPAGGRSATSLLSLCAVRTVGNHILHAPETANKPPMAPAACGPRVCQTYGRMGGSPDGAAGRRVSLRAACPRRGRPSARASPAMCICGLAARIEPPVSGCACHRPRSRTRRTRTTSTMPARHDPRSSAPPRNASIPADAKHRRDPVRPEPSRRMPAAWGSTSVTRAELGGQRP